MVGIIRAEDLPENERVYLKKDLIGWRVVEAWKDPYTNKINWFNLLTGGKRNLLFLFILFIIGLILYLAFKEQLTNYKFVIHNSYEYCKQFSSSTINYNNFSFSKIN